MLRIHSIAVKGEEEAFFGFRVKTNSEEKAEKQELKAPISWLRCEKWVGGLGREHPGLKTSGGSMGD